MNVLRKITNFLTKKKRFALGLLAGSTAVGTLPGTPQAHAADQPNIIFIMADDLGWRDIDCHDSECREQEDDSNCICKDGGANIYDERAFTTPHLTVLREAGMRFSNAYAYPFCSPTRACLMTGKYPARVAITDTPNAITGKRNHKGELNPGYYNMALPHDEITIAEMLKDQGYTTGLIGKWHLNSPTNLPTLQAFQPNTVHHGFDYFVGDQFDASFAYWEPGNNPYSWDTTNTCGMTGFYDDEGTLWGDVRLDDKDYLTDHYGDKAAQFIENRGDDPYFLYLSFHNPHVTLVPKDPTKVTLIDKYTNMIKVLDENVGKVLTAVDPNYPQNPLNIPDDTIIVFFSDNGARTSWGTGTSNAPLRGEKGHLYEGGIRVPLIIAGSDIPDSNTCDTPVHVVDFFPTFLDLADPADYMANRKEYLLDGASLTCMLDDISTNDFRDVDGDGIEDDDEDAIFWHVPRWHTNEPGSAVRLGNYKLIKRYDESNYEWNDPNFHTELMIDGLPNPKFGQLKYNAPASYELYDLVNDVGEVNNLYANRPDPDPFPNLKSLLSDWQVEVNAQMPRPAAVNIKQGEIYRFIADAISAADEDDEIVILPGMYGSFKLGTVWTHQGRIDIDKDITLRSIDPNDPEIVAKTVIYGGRYFKDGYGEEGNSFITITADDVKLQGLTIAGGYVDGDGGGINANGNPGLIEKCVIRNNYCTGDGGGIYNFAGEVKQCTIIENESEGNGGGLADCNDVSNSIIAQNRTNGEGGGLYNCDGNITNCTIAGNLVLGGSTGDGGGLYNCDGDITNCIIWGNEPNVYAGSSGTITHSCYPNGTGTNIDQDPEFVNYFTDIIWTSADANPDEPPSTSDFLFDDLIVTELGDIENGSIIEYNNDGVLRTVHDVTDHETYYTVEFHPPISPETEADKPVYIWPAGTTTVIEDYR